MNRTGARVAVTVFDPWREVQCIQVCGWRAAKTTAAGSTAEAKAHTVETGHETAVIRHASTHYRRRES